MRNCILLLMTCFSTAAFSQSAKKEINEQVWKPFMQTFNDRDSKGFMALHSKDVVRSSRDSRKVLNWQQYSDEQTKWDEQEKAEKLKRTLELRFTERISSSDQAIDVGIYKTTYISPDGTTRSFFGRFHVVLRKEQGKWKILVDTDSSENNTISEKDFHAASAME